MKALFLLVIWKVGTKRTFEIKKEDLSIAVLIYFTVKSLTFQSLWLILSSFMYLHEYHQIPFQEQNLNVSTETSNENDPWNLKRLRLQSCTVPCHKSLQRRFCFRLKMMNISGTQTKTEKSLPSDFLITGLDNFPTLDMDRTETKDGLYFWILWLISLKGFVLLRKLVTCWAPAGLWLMQTNQTTL